MLTEENLKNIAVLVNLAFQHGEVKSPKEASALLDIIQKCESIAADMKAVKAGGGSRD